MTKENDKIIGARIRELRTVLGIKQRELGKHLDVSFQQIQKYERGVNRIGAGNITKICDILKICPNDLFLVSSTTPLEAPKATLNLMRDYNKCTANIQCHINALVSELAN